jgi:hypothetical protein
LRMTRSGALPCVVFTGKGIDPRTNKLRTRDEWTALANEKGYLVEDKVGPGVDYLVSSRNDTKKAKAAAFWSVKVISYNDFAAILRGADLADEFDQTAPPPLSLDMEGMEEIAGWGMF